LNVVHAIIYLSLFNIFLSVGVNLTLFGDMSQHQLATTDPYNLSFGGTTYNTANFTSATFNDLLKSVLLTSAFFAIIGAFVSSAISMPVLTGVAYSLFLGVFVGMWINALTALNNAANLMNGYIPVVPGIFVGILCFTMFLQIIFTIMQIASGGWRMHL